LKNHAPAELAKLDPNDIAEIDKQFNACKARFQNTQGKLRGSWSSVSLAERATNVGLEEMYRTLYVIGSQLTHVTVGALKMHFNVVEDEHRIAVPPTLAWSAQAFNSGHFCLLHMLHTFCQVFNVTSEPPVEDLEKEYKEVWAKLPSQSGKQRGKRGKPSSLVVIIGAEVNTGGAEGQQTP